MITHLWYTNGVIHHAPVCARATLAPLRGKQNYQHLVFLPPSLRFASLRLDLIHGRSSRINRVHGSDFIPLDVVLENVCEREDRQEDTLGMNERSHQSLLTRLFVPY